MFEKRLSKDHQFAEDLATAGLNPSELRRWSECMSGHRFLIATSHKLVVYSYVDKKPLLLDTLTLWKFQVDQNCKELSSVWVNSSGTPIQVGYAPREVAKGCFLFHVKETSIVNRNGKLLISMAYRTRFNPNTKVRDVQYLQEELPFNVLLKGV